MWLQGPASQHLERGNLLLFSKQASDGAHENEGAGLGHRTWIFLPSALMLASAPRHAFILVFVKRLGSRPSQVSAAAISPEPLTLLGPNIGWPSAYAY